MSTESAKRIERAKFLFDQRRWKEAEAELRRALSAQEEKGTALYWLAWTQLRQGNLKEAEEAASRVIVEDPEMGRGYYVRSVVLEEMGKAPEDYETARTAVRKAPGVTEYRAHLGWMLASRGWQKEALELIDEGLRQDAEAVNLHQVRTHALLSLGRVDDAAESARHAVSLDPGDATSMAQLGAVAFRQKDLAAAQEHYAAALRISPGSTYARNGLLKTMRTRTWIYRLFMPKRDGKQQPRSARRNVGLAYLGIFSFGLLARLLPAAAAIVLVALIALSAFTVLRLCVEAAFGPLSALVLRLNPIGRAALSRDEIRCSNCVGLMLAAAVVEFGLAAVGVRLGFAVGLLLIFLVIPVTRMFSQTGRKRTIARGYVCGLAALGMGAIVAFKLHEHWAYWLLAGFAMAWMLFMTIYPARAKW